MSEQFAFKQTVGQRRAVDGDQRFVGAVARLMNSAGGQFLAGAAFTPDQNGCGGRSDLMDQLEDVQCSHILADDGGIAVFLRQRPLRQIVFLRQADAIFLQALEGVGETHFPFCQPLIDGHRVFTAGVITAGATIEFIPLDKFVRRLQHLADAFPTGQIKALVLVGEVAGEVGNGGRFQIVWRSDVGSIVVLVVFENEIAFRESCQTVVFPGPPIQPPLQKRTSTRRGVMRPAARSLINSRALSSPVVLTNSGLKKSLRMPKV